MIIRRLLGTAVLLTGFGWSAWATPEEDFALAYSKKTDPSAIPLFKKVAGDKTADVKLRVQSFVALAELYTAQKRYQMAIDMDTQAAELVAFKEEPELKWAIHQRLSKNYGLAEMWSKSISSLVPLVVDKEFAIHGGGQWFRSTVSTLASSAQKCKEEKMVIEALSANVEHIAAASVAASTVHIIADLYTTLGQPELAVATIKDELRRYADKYARGDVHYYLVLQNSLAKLYFHQLDDPAAAETECRDVITAGSSASEANLNVAAAVIDAHLILGDMYIAAERTEEAKEVYLNLLERPHLSVGPAFSKHFARLLELHPSKEQAEALCLSFREHVAVPTRHDSTKGNRYQRAIVLLLTAIGEPEAALQEAKLYYYSCQPQVILEATDLVASAFKANDFNLIRANRFLKFQRFGPAGEDEKLGTEDDLSNVLHELPRIADGTRADALRAAVASSSVSWTGHQVRGRLFILLDQPREALEAFRAAFLECPVGGPYMQRTMDALTDLVIRYTRDVALAESLASYVMYGEAGRDQKVGTPDDLQDPFPVILGKVDGPRRDAQEKEVP